MFRRRIKRSWIRRLQDVLYPPGGFGRAIRYVAYRVRRLPDPAHKISRGIAAGVFTCFTPFFGFHFLIAAVLGYVMRGNVLAALLSTFFGNPLTFPFIASISIEMGYDILGIDRQISLPRLFGAFSRAGHDLWANFRAIFTVDVTNWAGMADFFHDLFLPYLVGGLIPGVVFACVAYALSRPVIATYQKARISRLKKSYEKRLQRAAAARARKGRET